MNETPPELPTAQVPVVDRRTLLLGAGALGLAACTSDAVSRDVANSDPTSPDPAASTPDDSSTGSLGTASPDSGSGGVADATVSDEITEPPLTDALVADVVAPLGAGDFDAVPICAVLPETPAGPFPTIERLDRRDITEGYPGHPLRLGLRVVDAGCVPIPDARVEIWHTDASGDYSSYVDNGSGKDEGAGTTFMRGSQMTDPNGITEFATVYPGWYSGRVVHIHVRVHIGDANVLTTQLYLDDDYTNEVFATPPYAEFGPQDTTWATDGLIGDPRTDGTAITLRPGDTDLGPGTLGLANIGIAS